MRSLSSRRKVVDGPWTFRRCCDISIVSLFAVFFHLDFSLSVMVLPTSTPWRGPHSACLETWGRRTVDGYEVTHLTQVQILQRWRNPTPSINHYKGNTPSYRDRFVVQGVCESMP